MRLRSDITKQKLAQNTIEINDNYSVKPEETWKHPLHNHIPFSRTSLVGCEFDTLGLSPIRRCPFPIEVEEKVVGKEDITMNSKELGGHHLHLM